MRRLVTAAVLALLTASVPVTAAAGTTILSDAELAAATTRIDRLGDAPASVAGWGTDPATRTLVVSVTGDGDAAARAFVARARSAAGVPVRMETGVPRPRLLWNLFGGHPLVYPSGEQCSMAFHAHGAGGVRYAITAGHCSGVGATVKGWGGATIGPFVAASFPGNDFGIVRVALADVVTPPVVARYPGTLTVAGHGSWTPRMCMSAAYSGWRCGDYRGSGYTINTIPGPVYGLIRTNICAAAGDSGGALVTEPAVGQTTVTAIGIVTAGTTGGPCYSYFQPVGEPLLAYGLTLDTG